MLPFYRKIRQRLADDNQFLKYSRYAIGEIILVVIGILIALQINNWNENKKSNRMKNVYLQGLINDIEKDTSTINFVISEIELSQKAIAAMIKSIESNNDLEALDSITRNYLQRGWIIQEWAPSKNTYVHLSQTGNLNILSNTDLIEEIIQYYSYTTQVENSNTVNKNWITPIDQEIAKTTPAFELDPVTAQLFKHKSKSASLKNFQLNQDLIERNAAGHYWINQSLVSNLIAIKGLCTELLLELHAEYDLTTNP